jgi:hypothetical protein
LRAQWSALEQASIPMRQHNLHAPQLFATHDVPAPVYAVHLEQALGQIKADCRNHEEGANWIFKSAKGMTIHR